jgi:hypothetical protein
MSPCATSTTPPTRAGCSKAPTRARCTSFLESQVIELIRYGDTNGDGCVDDADLLLVLFNFGATGANPADVNGSGIVDDADLLDVLFNFGRGC